MHKVFEKTLPTSNSTAFKEYITLVILYAMIKLHIIGMLNYHEEWSDDLTITCIQSISRVIEHNDTYLKNINQILEENYLTSMVYMVIFIKNWFGYPLN